MLFYCPCGRKRFFYVLEAPQHTQCPGASGTRKLTCAPFLWRRREEPLFRSAEGRGAFDDTGVAQLPRGALVIGEHAVAVHLDGIPRTVVRADEQSACHKEQHPHGRRWQSRPRARNAVRTAQRSTTDHMHATPCTQPSAPEGRWADVVTVAGAGRDTPLHLCTYHWAAGSLEVGRWRPRASCRSSGGSAVSCPRSSPSLGRP